MKNIFIVEDDRKMALAVESTLKNEQYNIESFDSTKQFLEKIKDTHPDLVILDIVLPDGDGRQLCDILKRDPITAHIPVIMISGYFTQDQITYDACADGYLQKPFDVEDLRYMVKHSFN